MSPARSSGRELDPDLEEIAWLAAEIGAAPIAVVALALADDAPSFRCAARVGASAAAAEDAVACALAIGVAKDTVSVPDLLDDARFSGHAALAPPLQARAFACAPMRATGGSILGAVAVFDLEPRPFLPWQLSAFERLARLAGRRLQAAAETRARDTRRERTLGALAGGLALEIQALQSQSGGTVAETLRRAAALARDLLALSGHRSLRPTPLDLNALVAEQARAADVCGRRLEVRLDRSIGPIAADGERLGPAIAGLVSRAAGGAVASAPEAFGNGALHLRTSEVSISDGRPAPLPAGRYVLLTIGEATPGGSLDGWSFDADAEGLSETRGLLRQSGARLGTAVGASGRVAFCIALPRAAD